MENEDIKTKPLTKTAKLDATTDAAYEIIDRQVADRDKKTAKLKALRLAREAEAAPAPSPRKRRSSG